MAKKDFEVEVDGNKTKFIVKSPSLATSQQGQLVYSREFARLVRIHNGQSGAIVKAALDTVLREQGLWNDSKQKLWEELNKRLTGSEMKLAKGGIKLSEAREMAIQMRRDRFQLRELLAPRHDLEVNTAEAQAEQSKFNYFVSACTFTAEGKPVFKDENDYLNRATDEIGRKAALAFGEIYYNLDENFEKGLPENKFLLKYKFAREGDLHLVDKDGQLVDAKGRRVNDKGQLINEKSERVDDEGNLLTEDGEYKVDFVDFIDDLEPSVQVTMPSGV